MISTPPGATAGTESPSALGCIIAKFAVFKGAIPELWIVFAIKFVMIAAYQATNLTIVLWLHSDLGCKDEQALPMVAT